MRQALSARVGGQPGGQRVSLVLQLPRRRTLVPCHDRDIGRSFWSRWTCSLATYVIIQAKTYCWGHLTCLSDTKVYSIVNQTSPRIFLSFSNLWTISCNCIRDLINRNTAHEYFLVYQMHCARTLENRNYLHHFQQMFYKAKACFQLTAGQLKSRATSHHRGHIAKHKEQ